SSAEALKQPGVDRARGLCRELLADDRAHQRAVVIVGTAGSGIAEAGQTADPVNHLAQNRIAAAEMLDGLAPGGGGAEMLHPLARRAAAHGSVDSVTVSAAPS